MISPIHFRSSIVATPEDKKKAQEQTKETEVQVATAVIKKAEEAGKITPEQAAALKNIVIAAGKMESPVVH